MNLLDFEEKVVRVAEFYSKNAAIPVDYAGTSQCGWRNSILERREASGGIDA